MDLLAENDNVDAIELVIESNESSSEKESLREKIKKNISKLVTLDTESEEDKKQETRGRKKKAKTFFQDTVLPMVISACIAIAAYLTPERYKTPFSVNDRLYSFLPDETQWNGFLAPLARIADRHSKLSEINPDIVDLALSGKAIGLYFIELRSALVLKHYLDEQEERRRKNLRNRMFNQEFQDESTLGGLYTE